MQDFIVAPPLNGFPFILNKTALPETMYKWQLTRQEAMKLYWQSHLSDLNIDIKVVITSYGNTTTLSRNFSDNCTKVFMQTEGESIIEPYERVKYSSTSNMMYSFTKDPNDDSTDEVFEIDIYVPRYVDEDLYDVGISGSFTFYYKDTYFVMQIGKDSSTFVGTYTQIYEFSLSIFDKEVPCVVVQGGYISADSVDISATATISSTYVT